jgi:hypothetical protein
MAWVPARTAAGETGGGVGAMFNGCLIWIGVRNIYRAFEEIYIILKLFYTCKKEYSVATCRQGPLA